MAIKRVLLIKVKRRGGGRGRNEFGTEGYNVRQAREFVAGEELGFPRSKADGLQQRKSRSRYIDMEAKESNEFE
jgi:hypothetical protein